jgi:hypothetical protein
MMTGKKRRNQQRSQQRITMVELKNAILDAVDAYKALCDLTGRKGGHALRNMLESLRNYAYGAIQAVKDGAPNHNKNFQTFRFAKKITEDLEKQFDAAVEKGSDEVVDILEQVKREAPTLVAQHEPEIIRLQEAFRAAVAAEPCYHGAIITAYREMRQQAIELLRNVDSAKAAERERQRHERDIAVADEIEAELAAIDF